jgi:hypothetical protein
VAHLFVGDGGDIRMMRWIMLRLDQLAPTMGVEG